MAPSLLALLLLKSVVTTRLNTPSPSGVSVFRPTLFTSPCSAVNTTFCAHACGNSAVDTGANDCLHFVTPIGQCWNPRLLLANGSGVGRDQDILDTVTDMGVMRTVFLSTNGSCSQPLDSAATFSLDFGDCSNTIGDVARPFGVLECAARGGDGGATVADDKATGLQQSQQLPQALESTSASTTTVVVTDQPNPVCHFADPFEEVRASNRARVLLLLCLVQHIVRSSRVVDEGTDNASVFQSNIHVSLLSLVVLSVDRVAVTGMHAVRLVRSTN